MMMAASIITLLKSACIMHVTNLFVWQGYATRISDSIMTQASFRAIYNFVKGKPAIDVPFDDSTTKIHSIHRVLQSSVWSDAMSVEDIWMALLNKLQDADPLPYHSISIATSPPPTSYRSPLRRVFKSPRSSINHSPRAVDAAEIQVGKLDEIVKLWLAVYLRSALGMTKSADDANVSKDTFLKAVVRTMDSRIALKATLDDYISIVMKLDAALSVLAALVLLIICCIIAGVDLMTTGTTWLTFILAFSFLFGDTARKMFEGFILVFIWQAYAVSDRILIQDDSNEVQNLTVTKISLLTTELLRGDGMVYVMSNSAIQARDIRNISRGSFNCTTLTVKITDAIDSRVLDEFHQELETFRVSRFVHKIQSVSVQMRTVKDNGVTSEVMVCVTHVKNFEDSDERYRIHDCFARRAHDFFVKHKADTQPLVLACA
ncbi:hypothetical protein JKP88DRAFT_241038 [Tribonema minus]|uniref:Mechanosensitive ion channel n=1 Tax=Tribonema minus TaxID=303371 RepID=A0A836CK56_9STRA|nr:hypothetical protein JKP88DRAFT_241038 [Tribonema minus]